MGFLLAPTIPRERRLKFALSVFTILPLRLVQLYAIRSPCMFVPPFLCLVSALRKKVLFLRPSRRRRRGNKSWKPGNKIEPEQRREREIGLANNCWGHPPPLLPLLHLFFALSLSLSPFESPALPVLFHILGGANLHEPCNGNYRGTSRLFCVLCEDDVMASNCARAEVNPKSLTRS